MTIKKFVKRFKKENKGLEECYIAIMPNDEGYDLEIEVNEGTIGGTYSTGTEDLKDARAMANELEQALKVVDVYVYHSRDEWEEALAVGQIEDESNG